MPGGLPPTSVEPLAKVWCGMVWGLVDLFSTYVCVCAMGDDLQRIPLVARQDCWGG